MYRVHVNPTGSNKENLTNAKNPEDRNSTGATFKDMLPSADIHFQEGHHVLVTSPMVQLKSENTLSTSQPKNDTKPCRLSLATSNYSPIPRPTLYKSQSFTIGQNCSDLQYLHFSNVAYSSGFITSSPACNMNLSSGQIQLRGNIDSSTISLQEALSLQLPEQSKKRFSKHKSVNIPVSYGGSDNLSPGLLVKNLERSSILHLTATPDSGFCTPSFGIANETFSSTPKSSRVSIADIKNPNDLKIEHMSGESENVDIDFESPIDKSLHFGQWLQTYCTRDPAKSLTASPCNQSVDESDCSNLTWVIQSELQESASMDTSLQAVTPQLTLTPTCSQQGVSALSNPQVRKVLQEFDYNKCYGTKHSSLTEMQEFERPNYSYMDLIKMALKQSEDGEMTLREILSWIEDQFPYFKYKAKQSWKSSIRCNLSVHSDFTKVEGKKHGAKWKVADNARRYMHRLPKLPVIKHPIGPKVPAVTRSKTRRSGPLPILPKSVPYALVPLSLAALEQGSHSQHLKQQALQLFQHQQQPLQVSLQQQVLQLPLPSHQQASHVSLQQQSPIPLQQQDRNAKISQPLLNPVFSRVHQAKPGLLPIAPKIQQLPTAIIWDPKTFQICNQADSLCSSDSLSLPSNPETSVNANISLSNTPRTHKARTSLRSSTSDNVLQPSDIQIHQGGLANEKKIVFYFKQEQNHQPVASEVLDCGPHVSMSHGKSSHILVPTDKLLSSPARRICKSVDKIKRSKSFNSENNKRPYFRGKKFPGKNIGYICNENKEPFGRIPLSSDDDQRLEMDLSPDTTERSLTALSGPSPTKCLIKQAWDQAGAISESLGRDGQILDTSKSGKEHQHNIDGLSNTGCASGLVLSKRISASAAIKKKENQNTLVSDMCSHSADVTDSLLFHSVDGPFDGENIKACSKTSCGPISRRNECNTKKVLSRKGEVIQSKNNKVKQATLNIGEAASYLRCNPPDYLMQEMGENTSSTEASQSMCASKLVFHGTASFPSSSSQNSTSVPSSSTPKFVSSSEASPDSGFSSSQSTPLCSQPKFYRTRSRRKQIHIPLTTDISPDKVSLLLEPKTPIKDIPVSSTANNVSHNTTELAKSNSFTPPSGTGPTSHTTSSPNSDKPPLDFAMFLSKFSSSPHRNLCDGSHEIISPPPSSLILAPPSSCSHQSPFLSSTSTSSTSVKLPIRKDVRMNIQDSTSLTSQDFFRLSPVLSSTLPSETHTSGHVTSYPNFYPPVNFLNSSPPLLTNENVALSTSGQTFDNCLSLTNTPPAGNQPFSTTSTPTRGMQLPLEILQARANSSGFLDSSIFDNLDSLMQNSLYEFKTP